LVQVWAITNKYIYICVCVYNYFYPLGLTNGTQENGDSNSQLNNSNDLSVGDITIDSIKDHLGK